jgi:hypothetical protein
MSTIVVGKENSTRRGLRGMSVIRSVQTARRSAYRAAQISTPQPRHEYLTRGPATALASVAA